MPQSIECDWEQMAYMLMKHAYIQGRLDKIQKQAKEQQANKFFRNISTFSTCFQYLFINYTFQTLINSPRSFWRKKAAWLNKRMFARKTSRNKGD